MNKSVNYIISIDQGTSSSRCIVFNSLGESVSSHQVEHSQYYPNPGWVEHDPIQIWENTKTCLLESYATLRETSLSQFKAIGITNQRETTVVWNKLTGKPYHNAIVWNDTRSSSICDRISQTLGGKDSLRSLTGLPIATSYLLETVQGLRADAENGLALFGTIDSWLVWNLTGGAVHITDVTNASRTLLMNLSTRQWDDSLLSVFNIPRCMLPEIRSSSEVYGHLSLSDPAASHLNGIPIAGILGDQQAALFGQTCFQSGEAKCTYGTGCFLLMNTAQHNIPSQSGLLTTVAYQLGPDQPVCFALEGSVAYCGSLVQWLRDNMQFFERAADSEKLASEVSDNGGVYFVPAFAGLYAPYWREDARGLVAGLTAYNTKAHLVRAALESAAFQVWDVIDAMSKDCALSSCASSSASSSSPPLQLSKLFVDGGMSKNDLVMQLQSDLLGVPLIRPHSIETTALGAAFAAGLASGVEVWGSLDQLRALWRKGKEWGPQMTEEKRSDMLSHWRKAVDRSLGWTLQSPTPSISSSPHSSSSISDPLLMESSSLSSLPSLPPSSPTPTSLPPTVSPCSGPCSSCSWMGVGIVGLGVGVVLGMALQKAILSRL